MQIKAFNPVSTSPHRPSKAPFGCDRHSSVPKTTNTPSKRAFPSQNRELKLRESTPLPHPQFGVHFQSWWGRIPTKNIPGVQDVPFHGGAFPRCPYLRCGEGASATSPRRCWRFLAQGLSQQLCLRVLLSGQCHCHHCHQQCHAGHPPAARGRPAGLQDRKHRVGGVGGDLHVADHAFTAGNALLVGKRGINSGVIDYGVIDSAVIDSAVIDSGVIDSERL